MKLIETKDNNYTISINGINIHSRYSPVKEASKFIRQNMKNSGTVLILGAGLGYIFPAITEIYPNSNVISIPYNKELAACSLELNPTDRKQWNNIENIQDFLNSVINVMNIKGLQILEWNPTSRVYAKTAKSINEAIVKSIRRINGNLLTTARFGKRWLKNSMRNYILTDNYISDINLTGPVVIIASGKSLEKSIDTLKKIRNKITLISLSSANKALHYYNIVPDITFSTDPGYYSKLHMYGYSGIVAMPLTNSISIKNPVLLINNGNQFEEILIKTGNLPSISLGENGTVAGIALKFALTYSKYKIYLIGQDLQSSDIESHVKPYAFDNLLKNSETKINPYYSIMFNRWIKQGVSYKTYRDWFSITGKNNPGRILRVNANSLNIEGIKDINEHEFIEELNNISRIPLLSFSYIKNHNIIERQETCIKILREWLINVENKEFKNNSLFYLISTSSYTDANNKALSAIEIEKHIQHGKEESIIFIKRLLSLYGRQLL